MLITGSYDNIFTSTASESTMLDSAPYFYFGGLVLNNPDSDGFYWGLTGTALAPVYELGCYTGFSLKDKRTSNDIICDVTGYQGLIEKRDYLEISFTLNSILPLSLLTQVLRTGSVTHNVSEHTEKLGVGDVSNKNTYIPSMFQKVYLPNAAGDGAYFLAHFHRCQFVTAWTLNTPYANKWNIQVNLRAFADRTKNSGNWFGTFVRWDTVSE